MNRIECFTKMLAPYGWEVEQQADHMIRISRGSELYEDVVAIEFPPCDKAGFVESYFKIIQAGFDEKIPIQLYCEKTQTTKAKKHPAPDSEMIEKIQKIKNCLAIQSDQVSEDEYMRGMANGLVLAVSILEDKDPVYF